MLLTTHNIYQVLPSFASTGVPGLERCFECIPARSVSARRALRPVRPGGRASGARTVLERERESRLLNPPPGSTDPERFATVSIGIGDRVLFHPAPREPRHEWCEVSLRTETGRSQATCLGLSVGYPSARSKPRHFITTRQFQDPSARPACNADTATGPRGTL